MRVGSPQPLSRTGSKPTAVVGPHGAPTAAGALGLPPAGITPAQVATMQQYIAAMTQAGYSAQAIEQMLASHCAQTDYLAALQQQAHAHAQLGGSNHREQISPNSQKRRATTAAAAPAKPAVGPTSHQTKKPRVDSAAVSAAGNTATQMTSSSSTSPSSASRSASTQQQQQAGAFIDSFKTFVEKTVTEAFYQDNGSSTTSTATSSNMKATTVQATAVPRPAQLTTQQTPAAAAASVTSQSAPQVTSVTASDIPPPPAATKTTSTPPSLNDGKPSVSSAGLVTSHHAVTSVASLVPPSSVRVHSPSASISSISSIQDTINRVANGLDTDSDTLSAPSPPLGGGHANKDAPSPARSTSSNPATTAASAAAPRCHKKAILQRYSDEKVPGGGGRGAGSSSGSHCGSPVPSQQTDVTTNHDAGAPLPARRSNTNSPLVPSGCIRSGAPNEPSSSLPKNVRDDVTTSASETESSHSEDAKQRKKGQKRKNDSSSGLTSSSSRSATPQRSEKHSAKHHHKDVSDSESTTTPSHSAREQSTSSPSSSSSHGGKSKKSKAPPANSDSESMSSKEPPNKKKKKGLFCCFLTG